MVKDISDLEGLVIVGEIGGDSEEMLAQKIIDLGFNKPTVAYIAGRAAPKEKTNGACRCNSNGNLWISRIQSIHV